MSGFLVDSSVILDILTKDPVWYPWSSQALQQCADEAELFINPIVYAEVSIRFETIEEMESALPAESFGRLPLPFEASFLAGKAFRNYKTKGGTKSSTLPDFFIGAHAAVAGLRLVTRNASRCRTYFPTVELIAP
jgi:predicted nucleic acid-binding protein